MSKSQIYFSTLDRPTKPRQTHEQLADELAAWQAKGGQIKQLPSSQCADNWGDWKVRNELKRQRNREIDP